MPELGSYFTLQRGTTYQSSLLGQPGPVLLGLGTIQRNGGFRSDSLRTYGGESPTNLILHPGDLYVSLKDVTQAGDLLGAVSCVPPNVETGRLTQDTVKLVPKSPRKTPLRYLYWIMRTPQYREYCRARATGTTNLALSRDDFLAFDVPERGRSHHRLVELLDAIEDRLDLNRRTNETLESIARALFKSWFVNFDPVRANIEAAEWHNSPLESAFAATFANARARVTPAGWTRGAIGDVVENVRRSVQSGAIEQSMKYIGLENLPRRSLALYDWSHPGGISSNTFQFERGEILFGKLRPYFHKVAVAPIDGVCSTDILVMKAKGAEWFSFAVLAASTDEIVAYADAVSTGTKMPRCNWKDLASFEIPVPPVEIARTFDGYVRPMIDRMIASIHESRTLAALRDAVLPKLLAGDLRIRDAERVVGKAV